MAIYRDVGHEAEFAIPISLISRAKRHSHAYETHVKSEAPTLLRSPTASERDRHHAWSLPPFFPGCSSRQGLSSGPLQASSPITETPDVKQLAFLERWRWYRSWPPYSYVAQRLYK